MRLLLTNDDGVDAAGLGALAEALAGRHEVWVVAPHSNRSGTSHSVTLHEASRLRKRAERIYAASGSPADCVIVALLGVLEGRVDAVLSGINHGPNLGTDLLYSGTAAAAREASLHGVPGLAFSLCRYEPPHDFAAAARFVADNLERLRGLWSPGTFANVNFPDGGAYAGTELTVPCVRRYRDRLETFDSPRGETYCFLAGELPSAVPEHGSDHDAVSRGFVSVSLVPSQPARNGHASSRLEGFR